VIEKIFLHSTRGPRERNGAGRRRSFERCKGEIETDAGKRKCEEKRCKKNREMCERAAPVIYRSGNLGDVQRPPSLPYPPGTLPPLMLKSVCVCACVKRRERDRE
jgi:hypothetical protein